MLEFRAGIGGINLPYVWHRKTSLTGPKQIIERVKFRRREITPLHHFPSAIDKAIPKGRKRPGQRGRARRAFQFAALLMLLASVALGCLYLLLSQGVSSERLSQQAQAQLNSFLGDRFTATLGATRASLDRRRNLAIEAADVQVRDKASGKVLAAAKSVKLGVKAMALLRGVVDVARVEASGVTIDLTRASAPGDDFLSGFRGENGMLDPPQFVEAVFGAVRTARNAAANGGRQNIELSETVVKLGDPSKPESLRIDEMQITRDSGSLVKAEATLGWRGNPVNLTGSIAGDDAFVLQFSEYPIVVGASPGVLESDGSLTEPKLKTLAAMNVAGSSENGATVLRASAALADLAINTGRNRVISGSARIGVEMRSDSPKLEIMPSSVRMGASSVEFTGAVAPDPAKPENYRFEVVSTRGELMPSGSPEPPVLVSGQIRGGYDRTAMTLDLQDIGLRTLSGELYGQGALTFSSSWSPRIVLGLRVPKMSVSHAKQIWPVNAAFAARAWVFEHVRGGMLENSTLDLSIPEGRYSGEGPAPLLSESEFQADFEVSGTRFDVAGQLPPVRDASGVVKVRGVNTEVLLDSGTAFFENSQTASVSKGRLLIPYVRGQTTIADLDVVISGKAASIAAISAREPVNAMAKAPFAVADLSGSADARIKARFPLKKGAARSETTWSADIALKNVSIAKPFDGQTMTEANGRVTADAAGLKLTADAKLNGIPASLKLEQPLSGGSEKRKLSVQLELGEKARAKITPGLNQYVKGPIYVDLQSAGQSGRRISADLTKASINLDFTGWSKGPGVPAAATFALSQKEGRTLLEDFELSGESFVIRGTASLDKSGLASASLSQVKLVRGDNATAKITRTKNGYSVSVGGEALDVRALLKKVTGNFDSAAKSVGGLGVLVTANIGRVTGFNGESLSNLKMSYSGRGSRVDNLEINAATESGGAVALVNRVVDGQRQVQIQSADAGSILRFFDYYDKMSGGSINVSLASSGKGPLQGSIDARNFTLVNEPRMRSLVGGRSAEGGPSLKDAVKKDIDVSKVRFSRGSANIAKGANSLALDNGILRGELIGLAFRGTAYDQGGNINMSGTFMPAYGLNRIFGEIPLLGQLLGNGEERGLIGITFKLSGKAKTPQLTVNPISLIAPGIFRQIFEFQ